MTIPEVDVFLLQINFFGVISLVERVFGGDLAKG